MLWNYFSQCIETDTIITKTIYSEILTERKEIILSNNILPMIKFAESLFNKYHNKETKLQELKLLKEIIGKSGDNQLLISMIN